MFDEEKKEKIRKILRDRHATKKFFKKVNEIEEEQLKKIDKLCTFVEDEKIAFIIKTLFYRIVNDSDSMGNLAEAQAEQIHELKEQIMGLSEIMQRTDKERGAEAKKFYDHLVEQNKKVEDIHKHKDTLNLVEEIFKDRLGDSEDE